MTGPTLGSVSGGRLPLVPLPVACMRKAACGSRPDLPWVADEPGLTATAAMQGVCRECRVLDACTGYVQDAGIVGGFWAGLSRTLHPGLSHAVQGVLFEQAG